MRICAEPATIAEAVEGFGKPTAARLITAAAEALAEIETAAAA